MDCSIASALLSLRIDLSIAMFGASDTVVRYHLVLVPVVLGTLIALVVVVE